MNVKTTLEDLDLKLLINEKSNTSWGKWDKMGVLQNEERMRNWIKAMMVKDLENISVDRQNFIQIPVYRSHL